MLRRAVKQGIFAPFPSGAEMTPLGVLIIAGLLNFQAMTWFLLMGMPPTCIPHMLVNAVATPALFLLGAAWVTCRLLGLVSPESGTGFGLAGFALAARVQCELYVWIGSPPGNFVFGATVPPPTLVALVRYGGLVAYVMGVAFVVASSVQSALERRKGPRRPGAWTIAVLVLCVVGYYAYFIAQAPSHLFRP